jgi:hypothetical protein
MAYLFYYPSGQSYIAVINWLALFSSNWRTQVSKIWVTVILLLTSGVTCIVDAQEISSKRPDVVAVYYPHWHNYDLGSAWEGEGWTEWQVMNAAKPKFPGHEQPKVCTWGNFDESDPKWVGKEIDLAADHGIDVFLYDWYWYNGVKCMEEALEQGFLKAPNRNRMKFALMWANHNRSWGINAEFGKPRPVHLYIHHSLHDMERVIDYGIEHYFREPNYWKVDGGLFFSIFQTENFVKQLGGPAETLNALQKMNERLKNAGLPPMHWNAMVSSIESAKLAKQAGFNSVSKYNIVSANKAMPDWTERYEDIMGAHRKYWEMMTDSSPIVNMPVVTMGWDVTPRCRQDDTWPYPHKEYPYVPVVVGNTPALYEQLLQDARKQCEKDPKKPFGVLLNAWNEWTEGAYLLPEKRTGTQYLEAIKKVFGIKSK